MWKKFVPPNTSSFDNLTELTLLRTQARQLILRSSGAERTLELATKHSDLARKALEGLPDSEARTALDEMARDTLTRRK